MPLLALLNRTTVRASVWTTTSLLGARALSFVSSLIMTRLLYREAFGLMVIVNTYVYGFRMLSDLGIGPSIIQNPRSREPAFLHTAWTMQAIRGAVLTGLAMVTAWPIARFYGQPSLLPLLIAVGSTGFLAGLESTALHTLNRDLKLGRLTAVEIASHAVSVVVMVIWALLSPTVWALAVGAVTQALVQTTLSHIALPGLRPRIQWDPDIAREVFRFGKWIFLSSALGFLAAQGDRLILGKLFSMEFLGVYHIAVMLSSIPDQLVAKLGYKVMFPAISRNKGKPRGELRSIILRNRKPLILVLAVGLGTLVSLADFVVWLAYDPRFEQAGWILSSLALGLWPRLLANTMGPALLALGFPHFLTYSAGCRFLLLILGVPVAHQAFGAAGAVLVIAASGLIDYVIEGWCLWKQGLYPGFQDALACMTFAGTLGLALGIRLTLGFSLPFFPP